MNTPASILPIRVSQSHVKRWQRCPYSWYCAAILGIEQRGGPASETKDRGTIFHAYLEYAVKRYAATGEVYCFAADEGQEQARRISEELFDTRGVSVSEETAWELLEAIRWHVPRLRLEQWEVVRLADGTPLIEHDLTVAWDIDIELAARVDVVFRHRTTGKIWLVDWKTTVYNLDATLRPYVEHDMQLVIQRTVLAAHGIHVDIAALCRIRSLAPRFPSVTSRGKVSRDKSKLACDWPTYELALVANGEATDTDDLIPVREYLAASTFVQWCVDITSQDARDAMLKQVTRTALDMRTYARQAEESTTSALRVAVPRNIDATRPRYGCNDCEYQLWCDAALRQGGRPDLRQLALNYKPVDGSMLTDVAVPLALSPTPDEIYVQFTESHGRTLTPTQEFTP